MEKQVYGYRIACVIVTYNRSALLRRCLSAVLAQSYLPEKIYVIDNASTDDTSEVTESFGDSRIEYVRLPENMGGAGGFHEGMKRAHETGDFDAVWVMDDDGAPSRDCLANQLPYLRDHHFIGALVLDIEHPDRAAIPCLKERSIEEFEASYGASGLIHDYANPFNGILFSKELISAIGYPKKEMFIWGDEMEYQRRAIFHGYSPVTVIKARHFHPAANIGDDMKRDLFGALVITDTSSDLRQYCKLRNTAYYLKKYASSKSCLALLLRYICYYSLQRPSVSRLRLSLRAIYHGLRGDFTHHKDFMAHNDKNHSNRGK